MSEPKAWYKMVTVVSGPACYQGKTGYLDEATGLVFFDPEGEVGGLTTRFGDAYLAALLVLDPVRSKSERNQSTKLKSDTTDAFAT